MTTEESIHQTIDQIINAVMPNTVTPAMVGSVLDYLHGFVIQLRTSKVSVPEVNGQSGDVLSTDGQGGTAWTTPQQGTAGSGSTGGIAATRNLLKGDGSGNAVSATPGTDYLTEDDKENLAEDISRLSSDIAAIANTLNCVLLIEQSDLGSYGEDELTEAIVRHEVVVYHDEDNDRRYLMVEDSGQDFLFTCVTNGGVYFFALWYGSQWEIRNSGYKEFVSGGTTYTEGKNINITNGSISTAEVLEDIEQVVSPEGEPLMLSTYEHTLQISDDGEGNPVVDIDGDPLSTKTYVDIASGSIYEALSERESTSNKVTSISQQSTNTQYPSAKAVYEICNVIQALVSQVSANVTQNQNAINGLDTSLSGKESTSNKVTSISQQSTNTQYPSAKAVYSAVNDLSGSIVQMLTDYMQKMQSAAGGMIIVSKEDGTVEESGHTVDELKNVLFGYLISSATCRYRWQFEFDQSIYSPSADARSYVYVSLLLGNVEHKIPVEIFYEDLWDIPQRFAEGVVDGIQTLMGLSAAVESYSGTGCAVVISSQQELQLLGDIYVYSLNRDSLFNPPLYSGDPFPWISSRDITTIAPITGGKGFYALNDPASDRYEDSEDKVYIDLISKAAYIYYSGDYHKFVAEGGGGGGTTDYDNLSNKPRINGHALTGNQTAAALGLIAAPSSAGVENQVLTRTSSGVAWEDPLRVIVNRADTLVARLRTTYRGEKINLSFVTEKFLDEMTKVTPDPKFDINGDGAVNISDLTLFTEVSYVLARRQVDDLETKVDDIIDGSGAEFQIPQGVQGENWITLSESSEPKLSTVTNMLRRAQNGQVNIFVKKNITGWPFAVIDKYEYTHRMLDGVDTPCLFHLWPYCPSGDITYDAIYFKVDNGSYKIMYTFSKLIADE